MRKVCQLSHSGLVWLCWAGEMVGKIWTLGHAEKNNWDMGTLSRMIAGHKGKGGTRGRKIMEFCLLVRNMEDGLVGRGEGILSLFGLKVKLWGPGAA